MDKIMVIENQITQFETISEYLNSNYQTVPTSVDYLTLIDNVRVWINKQYTSLHRKSAFNYIYEFINSEGICLILMDYKLGGAHSSRKGTDLAKKINKKRKENNVSALPVIFLSKSEHTDKIRIQDFEAYKKIFHNTQWVHKGYFGEEILEKTYFRKYILDEIEKMLPMEILERTIEILDEFIKRKEPINNLSGGETSKMKQSLKNCHELLLKIKTKNTITENVLMKVQKLTKMENELGYTKFNSLIIEISNEI